MQYFREVDGRKVFEKAYRQRWGTERIWPKDIGLGEGILNKVFFTKSQEKEYNDKDAEAALRFSRNMLVHIAESYIKEVKKLEKLGASIEPTPSSVTVCT